MRLFLFLLHLSLIMAFIQWNCRGFRVNFNELALISQEYNSQAICLQETHHKQSDNISMRNFTFYGRASADQDRAKGGAAVLVREGVIHS